jgi:hypothetical protein
LTQEQLQAKWRDLVADLRRGRDDGELRAELEALAHELQGDLFGGRPAADATYAAAADDPRLRMLLDALGTLMLLEPDDPSYPWDRGLVLGVVGRPLEAADDYLIAARLFVDEPEWATSALGHAARALALGGHAAAAAALVPRLDREDRPEVEALLATS